jgi:hypothetical protein
MCPVDDPGHLDGFRHCSSPTGTPTGQNADVPS